MDENLLKSLSQLESNLSKHKSSKEALRIFCMYSVKLFRDSENVIVRVNQGDLRLFCENGIEKKPFFSVPFSIDQEDYFYEVFFNEERSISLTKEDFDIFSKLVMVISRELGEIEDEILQNFDSNIERKNNFVLNSVKENSADEFLFNNFYQRDILYDLMPFKVKEILLIASLYDAFTIENEGNFTQKILGEFSKLNLTSFPRVTAVSSYPDAYKKMTSKHYDLIIVMVGNDRDTPIQVIETLKKDFDYLPVYLLLNNNADVSEFQKYKENNFVDNLFIWNGDSRIFFSMVKLLEDRLNLENDTKIGHTRLILLVEDTARFYSRYLPDLYLIIFKQTRSVMENITETDEMYKVLSGRVRPKS